METSIYRDGRISTGSNFTNKTAENMYNNAKKTVKNLSDTEKAIRDDVITGLEYSLGPAGLASGAVRNHFNVTNDEIHETLIKKTAVEIDRDVRIADNVRKGVQATKDHLKERSKKVADDVSKNGVHGKKYNEKPRTIGDVLREGGKRVADDFNKNGVHGKRYR